MVIASVVIFNVVLNIMAGRSIEKYFREGKNPLFMELGVKTNMENGVLEIRKAWFGYLLILYSLIDMIDDFFLSRCLFNSWE